MMNDESLRFYLLLRTQDRPCLTSSTSACILTTSVSDCISNPIMLYLSVHASHLFHFLSFLHDPIITPVLCLYPCCLLFHVLLSVPHCLTAKSGYHTSKCFHCLALLTIHVHVCLCVLSMDPHESFIYLLIPPSLTVGTSGCCVRYV